MKVSFFIISFLLSLVVSIEAYATLAVPNNTPQVSKKSKATTALSPAEHCDNQLSIFLINGFKTAAGSNDWYFNSDRKDIFLARCIETIEMLQGSKLTPQEMKNAANESLKKYLLNECETDVEHREAIRNALFEFNKSTSHQAQSSSKTAVN